MRDQVPFERTLQRQWGLFEIVRPPREKRLPVGLSREEVRRILAGVRLPGSRVCLTTISACGLRLMEGARLQVPDVDSARLQLPIHGKGGRDRSVPVPDQRLPLLREPWRTPRSPRWLFPAPTRRGLPSSLAQDAGPVTRSSVQSAFRRALSHGGCHQRAQGHTLRHASATPRLEAGVTRRLIQASLGHGSARTPQLYTPLTREVRAAAQDPINRVLADR